MPRKIVSAIPPSDHLAQEFIRALRLSGLDYAKFSDRLAHKGIRMSREVIRKIGSGERGIEQWLLEEVDALTGGDLADAVQAAQSAPQQKYNSRLIRPLGRLVSGQLAPEENMNPVPVILPSSMLAADLQAVILEGSDYVHFPRGAYVIYMDTGIWASGAIHLAKSGDRVELVVPMRTSEGLICRRLIIGGGDEPLEEWRPIGLVVITGRISPEGIYL